MSRTSNHPTERDRPGLQMAIAALSRREALYPGAADLVKLLLEQIDNKHTAHELSYDALIDDLNNCRISWGLLYTENDRLRALLTGPGSSHGM